MTFSLCQLKRLNFGSGNISIIYLSVSHVLVSPFFLILSLRRLLIPSYLTMSERHYDIH